MALLPVLLLLLMAIGCRTQVTPWPGRPKTNIHSCHRMLHQMGTNLTRVVECLARSTNLTAQQEDTLWKLELLERKLDRLELTMPSHQYKPSPYKDIDDVLKIEGSVAGYDCQGKRHVVQAIRRKLEMVSLFSDIPSKMFVWPWPLAIPFDVNVKMPDQGLGGVTSADRDVEELRCQIVGAIERNPDKDRGQ